MELHAQPFSHRTAVDDPNTHKAVSTFIALVGSPVFRAFLGYFPEQSSDATILQRLTAWDD